MIIWVLGLVFIGLTWGVVLGFGLPLWYAALATLVVLLVLLLRWGYRALKAKRATAEIERSLADQAEEYARRARPDQQAEIRALQSEFQKALEALSRSKLARTRAGALYALPWYVIIGPPGAGKSTALRNCGLKFPYQTERGGVRGVGGTRNCDWWLTNEAVLLDTAGRYATQENDREEWLSFLDMLRSHRSKQPLNGLILAISVGDIAAADEAQLETLAARMRERVDEVMDRLRMVVPVYVLITKCDLIPGFTESFEDLRRTERGQLFGFTLPVREAVKSADETFEHHFTRLVQVVERRAIARMADERRPAARSRIYEFPQQLEALGPSLKHFFADVFVENVFREAPMVRGVYFTSGTQEGNPIDRVMQGMAAAFGLAPPAASQAAPAVEARSYFLRDMFAEIMFPDQHLASRSGAEQRRLRWLRAGIAAALCAAAAVLTVSASASYLGNRSLLGSTRDMIAKVTAHEHAKGDTAVPLGLLDPLRERLSELHRWDVEGPPLTLGLGLYTGGDLYEPVRHFYASAGRKVLIAPVVAQLAKDLRAAVKAHDTLAEVLSAQEQALAYDRLRAYLLLTSPRGPAEPALQGKLLDELTTKVAQTVVTVLGGEVEPAKRALIESHVRAYVELLSADPELSFVRDEYLVRRSREVLSQVPATKLALDRLVSDIERLGWDLNLSKMVGGTGLPITAAGRVNGAFTRRAWDEYLRELLSTLPEELVGDSWVLSAATSSEGGETVQARLCDLRSRYFARYIDEWTRFLGSVRVAEPGNNTDAITELQDLTRGSPPPLQRLMRTVANHARLKEKSSPKGPLEKAAEETGVLDRLRQRVEASPVQGLLKQQDPCEGGDHLLLRDVERALSGFYSFGVPPESEGDEPTAQAQLTAVEVYQEQLVFVRDALQTYLDDPTSSEPLLARLQTARTRVRGLIESQEIGWRPRFDSLLWPPINGASASSTSALAGQKGSQWCTSVVRPYARTLLGKYPFSPEGQDAALTDLSEFYRPQSGILWAFYESSLAKEVPRVGSRFQPRQGASVGSAFEGNLARFLERSQYISDVLFMRGNEQPRVDFEVRVRPSPGIASVLFTVDGQVVDFHNGPEKWIRLKWPGDGDKRGASLRVKGASIDETIGQAGEWGLFRLFDKGTISAKSGERFFTVRWRLRTQNDVVIDVRPARAENPFVGQRKYLEAFRSDDVQAPRSIAASSPPCAD